MCGSLLCASSQKHLTGLLGGKSLRNYRRMCLCLPARLQLSTVKAGRGSVSLQNACVCVVWAQKKKKREKKTGQLSQLHCKSIVWHKYGKDSHSPLVHPANKERGFLISVSDTRSGLQPTGRAQQRQRRFSPLLTEQTPNFLGRQEVYFAFCHFYFHCDAKKPKNLNLSWKKNKSDSARLESVLGFFLIQKGK